ncbi:uncharacterized protein LOC109860791 isoform X2 [Pseudomyrmex gracilis]|nr:uncharacterized protein LOC109860791 isoform X2 [Pseudomyrmex gracilis]XP_020295695.1 uncharacterized protein LOC109860791 isoform X2 [Pseudomyrmex gracilis]
MSLHLQRILSAKSVVDTKNKRYILAKRNHLCKVHKPEDKRFYSRLEETDDVINILAYDTHHHPMVVLRMNLNPKHINCCKLLNHQKMNVCCNGTCCEKNGQIDCVQQSVSKNRTLTHLPKHNKFMSEFICRKESKSTQKTYRIDPLTYSQQRYEKNLCAPCAITTESLSQETTDRCSVSSISKSDDYFDDKSAKKCASKQFLRQREKEEKQYIKFVYDITKEIMQKGLYTDKELRDVFKKHINQNKGVLNMNKMLCEIYQLKISLNILEDSDTDEELEDLVYAQKLLTVSEIRPPTPPKVLDENKVVEKLKSYQKMINSESKPSNFTGKSVTLVDANPDLLITERDVLMSLVEVGINPKQAQHICKTLLHKSRDTALIETVQVGAEVSYLLNNSKLQEMENLRVTDDSLIRQKADSSSLNLASAQDMTVETKGQIESQSVPNE